jgi:DNA-binding transcriptional regulator YdaS (Cro superfamily)
MPEDRAHPEDRVHTDKNNQYNRDMIKRAINMFGSSNRLALELKVTVITVYKWRDGKAVPSPENCLKIEKVTNGQVKARDIRPDLDWERIIENLKRTIEDLKSLF